MTDQTSPSAPPVDSGFHAGLPMSVKNKVLLAICATTPVAALIALVDQLFLDKQIHEFMKMDPRQIAYWTAVLTIPHIIASLITFIDREYVAHYKKPLVRGTIVGLALGFVLPIIFGPSGLLIAMAFYTMYHNLMQQYGISLMMMRQPPTRDFQAWRWMTIVPGGAAYTLLMISFMPVVRENWNMLLGALACVLLVATVFGIRFVRTILKNPAHTRIGLVYFLSNMAMLYVCFALIALGYGLLATLVPRVIHDLTAFLIYIVHDQNRNATEIRNPVYYIPEKLGISPAVLCMPLAIGISYVLMEVLGNLYLVSLLVTSLNFMHYYMEGHMWKRGTPHRQHVPFV
jgi:hypothetical protein